MHTLLINGSAGRPRVPMHPPYTQSAAPVGAISRVDSLPLLAKSQLTKIFISEVDVVHTRNSLGVSLSIVLPAPSMINLMIEQLAVGIINSPSIFLQSDLQFY